MNCYKDQET